MILNITSKIRKSLRVLGALLLVSSVAGTVAYAATPLLTASTSMTVVHVTDFRHGTASTVPGWGGDWPNDPTDVIIPGSQEVYLDNVHFTSHHMSWATTPGVTPYPTFPNTVNSMIAAIWSVNNGKSFIMQSWDYLAKTTHAKGIEGGMPNCWMGTMVHSVCDRKAGECNGRNKSNLFFTEYPSGNTNCWGTPD
jgi:hypothetical protein